MNEDFVSFDLAKKLKEKGYPQAEKNALAMYDEDGDWCSLSPTLDDYYYDFEGFDRHDFVCPTISQVLKWLREEKKIHICIGISIAPTFSWDYEIVNLDDDCYIHAECGYDSYEDAASNGISYILDNLI